MIRLADLLPYADYITRQLPPRCYADIVTRHAAEALLLSERLRLRCRGDITLAVGARYAEARAPRAAARQRCCCTHTLR